MKAVVNEDLTTYQTGGGFKKQCVCIYYMYYIYIIYTIIYIYTYYISLLYNKQYIHFIGLQMG